MARLPIIDRADMNADQARVHDAAKQAGSPVGGPYTAYIRLPKLYEAAQNLRGCLGSGPLSKRRSTLAAFTFTRLPESSSTCMELSASDITRPAWNLPASSYSAYIGGIVAERERMITEQDNRLVALNNGLIERDGHIASLYHTIAKFEAAPLRRAIRVARRGIAKLASSLRSGSRAP